MLLRQQRNKMALGLQVYAVLTILITRKYTIYGRNAINKHSYIKIINITASIPQGAVLAEYGIADRKFGRQKSKTNDPTISQS